MSEQCSRCSLPLCCHISYGSLTSIDCYSPSRYWITKLECQFLGNLMLNAHCDFHGNQLLLATTSHPGTLSDYQITVANPRKSHAESSLRFSWQLATPSYPFSPENLELVKAPGEVTLAMAASSAGLAKNIRYILQNAGNSSVAASVS